MKRRLQRLSIFLLLGCAGAPAAFAAAPAGAAFDTAPARAALQRLLPRQQAQFTLLALDRGQGADRFEVRGTPGHIVVGGTSPAVILTGVKPTWNRPHTSPSAGRATALRACRPRCRRPSRRSPAAPRCRTAMR